MSNHKNVMINPDKFHRSQIKFYIILLPIVAFMLLPLLFIFFNALKPMNELFAFPPIFVSRRPTLNNFKMLFRFTESSNQPLSHYIFNSVVSTFFVVLLSIMLSVCAGYVLSKKDFKLKKIIFQINTLSLMFVGTALTIPRFLIVNYLGLHDRFMALIIPMIAIPVGLFLIKQFIDQLPDALIEAAKIDGASDYYIIPKIVVPLIKPALSTVGILAFQAAWNSDEASKLFIERDSLKTLAYVIGTVATGTAASPAGTGIAAAGFLIMFVPNLILFIFMQSRVMNTMAHSGIK